MMIAKLVLIVAAAVLVVSAVPEPRRMIPDHLDFQSDEFIDYINNKLNTTWKAARNTRPEVSNKNLRNFRSSPRIDLDYRQDHPIRDGEIPEQFDSRERWPKCQTIKQVRDQGCCGSCWAFATVETISDRICIASNQTLVDVEISAENLLACCINCGYGCHGGSPSSAWEYYVNYGIVTGGLYGTNKTCQPYSIPRCNVPHQRKKPNCRHQCTISDYPKSYQEDLYWGKSAYRVGRNVEQIQKEIMTHGPVTAVFIVYPDLVQYKSGVYQRHSNIAKGGHAVKMIGWGVEGGGVPYWLTTNSWGVDSGENGFFKILRGSNECGIEEMIIAGLPC